MYPPLRSGEDPEEEGEESSACGVLDLDSPSTSASPPEPAPSGCSSNSPTISVNEPGAKWPRRSRTLIMYAVELLSAPAGDK